MARCWTNETAIALDTEISNDLPYNDYYEYYAPDFKLHLQPANLQNHNSPEYLEKIKCVFVKKLLSLLNCLVNFCVSLCRIKLLENLRNLPHAPGVQMTDIPPDGVNLEREHEAADEEADKHPDKRISIYASDKRVTRENELSDSEDEGEGGRRDAGAPGAGTRKKRKVEPAAADSQPQNGSGAQQPAAAAEPAAEPAIEQKSEAQPADS